MKLVEQAIFAPFGSDRDAGYQVIARSPGVCDVDARELFTWAPRSDSLLDDAAGEESLNFHPLPSGAYCLSRTSSMGWHRDGAQRVYTHCLVLPEEVLRRFANNPFAVAETTARRELWLPPNRSVSHLEAFALPGGAGAIDSTLIERLSADMGPRCMAALMQAAREAVCLVVQASQPQLWMAGLVSLLPPECRLEFSFTTGLKFSTRRPFRLGGLSNDPAERSWVTSYPNVRVLHLDPNAAGPAVTDDWARLVERALTLGRIDFLAAQLSKRRFDLTIDDLPALGLQLFESLDFFACGNNVAMELGGADSPATRAHVAHRQFQKSKEVAAGASADAVSARSFDIADRQFASPEMLEKLERLDDLVYEAISGQASSLAELQRQWPRILCDLGEEALAESREQYLRYALSTWEECARGATMREPDRAIQALDVLCLLFGDA